MPMSTVSPWGDASTELIKSTNLLVVGGPTHIRGMTSGRVMPQAAGMNSRQSDGLGFRRVVGEEHTSARHEHRGRSDSVV